MAQSVCSDVLAAELGVLAGQMRRVARLAEHADAVPADFRAVLRDQLDAVADHLDTDRRFIAQGGAR